MSITRIPIRAHGFTTSTYTPMECLNIDSLGPLPDKDYILVIVCTFTRWVELYLTTDATALSAAECLIKHFGRFGAPRQLRSFAHEFERSYESCQRIEFLLRTPRPFNWQREGL